MGQETGLELTLEMSEQANGRLRHPLLVRGCLKRCQLPRSQWRRHRYTVMEVRLCRGTDDIESLEMTEIVHECRYPFNDVSGGAPVIEEWRVTLPHITFGEEINLHSDHLDTCEHLSVDVGAQQRQ